MKKRQVIIFSGLDCSGKSTQIDFLKKEFSNKNQKSFVFWSRGGYTPGFEKLKNIIRFIIGSKIPKPGKSEKRDKAFSNKYIRKLWITVAMLDLILFYSFYLRLKNYLNYNIICDRFIMDTYIDFKLAFPTENTDSWLLWKLLKFTSIKPNLHFVSTIPVEESVIRSKTKFEPFPDPPETLEKRLDFYKKFLKIDKKLIHIDGMTDINKITKGINEKVGIL